SGCAIFTGSSPERHSEPTMTTLLYTHPACLEHDPGPYHPESPARLRAVLAALEAPELARLERREAPEAARDDIARVHPRRFIERMLAAVPASGHAGIDADTVLSPQSGRAALRAAGAVVAAVDAVVAGEADNAFCAVRPPGHHAEPARAMGFCLFNNVAVGACHAMAHHGIERIAIVDFDVHHGNGTEDIFRGDDRVLFCSSFQHPFYPYSSHQAATPRLVPISLPAGSGGPLFRQKISERWLPALEAFKPELLLVSAGFDGHILDDMSDLALREADFEWVTESILRVARRHARGRLVSVLEGGYELGALGRSVVSHLKPMLS
ncbi:MAG TPA: histone deacetylase family protein, partial [Kiloniellales bacterium]